MPFALPLFGMKGYGTTTASANTAIVALIEPMRNAYTVLTGFSLTCGNTAHTLTVMRPLGSSTIATSVAAAGTNCVLATNPGTYVAKSQSNNVIASQDWFVIQLDDGTFYMPVAKASNTGSNTSVSSLTLTTAAFPQSAAAGNKVWWFGVHGDVNVADNMAHPSFVGTANTAVVLGNAQAHNIAGLVATAGKFEPMILHVGNATNAGTIDWATAIYTNKGGPSTSNA
jgi:hypothetical protein